MSPMADTATITDIRTALSRRLFPTVALWNRLEGRPRTTEFDRALRAEVRDPLWMLARQWQFGEFRGQDAGSPVTATYHLRSAKATRYRALDGTPGPLPDRLPIEAVAEGRPVPFTVGGDQVSFDLRVAMGRRWSKLVSSSLRGKFLARWPIRLPDPAADADAPLVGHPDVWATMQAIAGRAMDGYALYRHLKDGGHAYDGIDKLSTAQKTALDGLAAKFTAWFEDLIAQPAPGREAFDTARLEHRFALGLPAVSGTSGETVLSAGEYPGGGLDWHSFSAGSSGGPLGTTGQAGTVTRTVVPAPARFSGMPNARWWTFEDGRTDFGAVTADTTDLVRLLFLEFALVYGNDWLVLPCDLDEGTLSRVDGVMVTDTFGQRFWIEPAGGGAADDWQRWSLFDLATTAGARSGLFLPPAAAGAIEGPAVEDALLVRDENANMVWGIERTVWLADGKPLSGAEAARETLAYRERLRPPAVPRVPVAAIAYEAMTTVPENWVPFIPVHVPGETRQIQLQRGAMRRILAGDTAPPARVRPRTTLLRPGLDTTPVHSYFLHEEEVPRAGTRLELSFRRARLADGRVVVWLGARRAAGRGGASSGLAWDVTVDTPG
jgi:hypothetical protein